MNRLIEGAFGLVGSLALAAAAFVLVAFRALLLEAVRVYGEHGVNGSPPARILGMALAGMLGSVALTAILLQVPGVGAEAFWPSVIGVVTWFATIEVVDQSARSRRNR